jgi:hypothetical protein
MAAGDQWIVASRVVHQGMPPRGITQVEGGGTTTIAWDNGQTVAYDDTDNLERIANANIADVVAWLSKRVQLLVANEGMRMRGVVVDVYVRDPAGTPELALLVKLDSSGLYGQFRTAQVAVVPT